MTALGFGRLKHSHCDLDVFVELFRLVLAVKGGRRRSGYSYSLISEIAIVSIKSVP